MLFLFMKPLKCTRKSLKIFRRPTGRRKNRRVRKPSSNVIFRKNRRVSTRRFRRFPSGIIYTERHTARISNIISGGTRPTGRQWPGESLWHVSPFQFFSVVISGPIALLLKVMESESPVVQTHESMLEPDQSGYRARKTLRRRKTSNHDRTDFLAKIYTKHEVYKILHDLECWDQADMYQKLLAMCAEPSKSNLKIVISPLVGGLWWPYGT